MAQTEQWWLLGKDRTPIGPVSQRLVLQGILAGRVPADSLVCEVGGAAWRPIREIALFTTAFAKLRIDGPTIVDPIRPDGFQNGQSPAQPGSRR